MEFYLVRIGQSNFVLPEIEVEIYDISQNRRKISKSKGKFHPRTGHGAPEGEWI
jgi:hypothetical protein